MKYLYKNGIASVVCRIKLLDTSSTTGGGKTGLDHTSAGLRIAAIADNEAATTAYTSAGSTVETITTLGTFAAPTATKCRFKEVDATSHPGLYEIQLADARWAVSGARSVIVTVQATGAAPVDAEVQLQGVVLGSDGLDGIAITAPAGVASTFREMVVQTWRRYFKKADRDTGAGTLKTYADDGSTVLTTQTISDVGDTQTVGSAS